MTAKARLIVEEKKRDYQLAFGSPAGQRVLTDLQAFCRATEGPYAPGDRDETMMRIGCLEVWLHIARHLELSSEQLFGLYTGRHVKIGETDA
jgi:hypothetical protein